MSDGNGTITYGYDNAGRLARKTFPNGMETSYAYDMAGRLSELTHRDQEGILDRYSYQYDLMGNKTVIEKQRRGLNEESGLYTYGYDALGRLNEVAKNGETLRNYEYDAFGNRSLLREGGRETTYIYNALNQLVSRVDAVNEDTYTYDKRGNLSLIMGNGALKNRYTYGTLNRLEQAVNGKGETASYLYNGLGHRVGKNIGPKTKIQYTIDLTKNYYNLLQKEEDGITQAYLWDGNVAEMADSMDYRYYLQDDLGSPIRLLDRRGELTDSYGYDEFGQDLYGNQGTVQPFGYTGYQYDGIAGTYFAQAREYLANMGRFNGKDAERFIKKRRTITLNLYLYCGANPLKYVDFNGHDCYIFYLPEWEEEAMDNQKSLMENYNISQNEVHLIPIKNNTELINGWNSMGMNNGNAVEIQTVVISTHANVTNLQFGSNSNDLFTMTEVQQLLNKDVEELVLYGCNAGHADYKGSNSASQFSLKTNGAPVIASDGTVLSGYSLQLRFWEAGAMEYTSVANKHFKNKLLNGGRKNLGWLIYTYDGKEVSFKESGRKNLKLLEMLNLVDAEKD